MLLAILPAKAYVAYPVPDEMPLEKGITIKADGKEVFVYGIEVNFNLQYQCDPPPTTAPTPIAYSDFFDSGKILIQREGLTTVIFRSLSRSIVPVIAGNLILINFKCV